LLIQWYIPWKTKRELGAFNSFFVDTHIGRAMTETRWEAFQFILCWYISNSLCSSSVLNSLSIHSLLILGCRACRNTTLRHSFNSFFVDTELDVAEWVWCARYRFQFILCWYGFRTDWSVWMTQFVFQFILCWYGSMALSSLPWNSLPFQFILCWYSLVVEHVTTGDNNFQFILCWYQHHQARSWANNKHFQFILCWYTSRTSWATHSSGCGLSIHSLLIRPLDLGEYFIVVPPFQFILCWYVYESYEFKIWCYPFSFQFILCWY